MAQESVFTAARRVLRFIRIDLEHGGLISRDTLAALDTLEREINCEAARAKRAPSPGAHQPAGSAP